MPKQKVFVLEKSESPWCDLLRDFFEDTDSAVMMTSEASDLKAALETGAAPVVFMDPALMSVNLAQALQALRQTHPDTRIFALGSEAGPKGILRPDYRFQELPSLSAFQKELIKHLPLPEKIQVLVVDNEVEIYDPGFF